MSTNSSAGLWVHLGDDTSERLLQFEDVRVLSPALPPLPALNCIKAQSMRFSSASRFHCKYWHYSSLTDENNDSTCRRMPGIPRLSRSMLDGSVQLWELVISDVTSHRGSFRLNEMGFITLASAKGRLCHAACDSNTLRLLYPLYLQDKLLLFDALIPRKNHNAILETLIKSLNYIERYIKPEVISLIYRVTLQILSSHDIFSIFNELKWLILNIKLFPRLSNFPVTLVWCRSVCSMLVGNVLCLNELH